MSERSARLVERGLERFNSAEEAWESLTERSDRLDWDGNAVRPDSEPGTENRHNVLADD